jgi:hypothetical protein
VENLTPEHEAYAELNDLVADFTKQNMGELKEAIAEHMGNTIQVWKKHYDVLAKDRQTWFAGKLRSLKSTTPQLL